MLGREPDYIPRTPVIFRPTRAFIAWVNDYEKARGEPDLPLADDASGIVYLLPDHLSPEAARDYIRKRAKRILKYYLSLYIEDRRAWPKRLDMNQLETFFALEYWSDVLDLVE